MYIDGLTGYYIVSTNYIAVMPSLNMLFYIMIIMAIMLVYGVKALMY